MEITLKEAELHHLKDGDLIVIQSLEVLTQDSYANMSKALNFLKKEIEKEAGKHINFLLCAPNIAIKHFRSAE